MNSLPWDQRTLLGYLGMDMFIVCCGESYYFTNGSLLMLFVSICLHHKIFFKTFRNAVQRLDSPEEITDQKKFFCELIQFHNLTKGQPFLQQAIQFIIIIMIISIEFIFRWFLETAELYSPYLMIQLISSTVFLATVTFELDLVIIH